MIKASLRQLPVATVAVAVAVVGIVFFRVLSGMTWETAIAQTDVWFWLYFIVVMSLWTGWLRYRKETPGETRIRS